MQIDLLKLRNFKGFSELDQRLNRRFTLIIGNNGAGKSSLLDALSVAFGSFLLGIQVTTARQNDQDEVREFERDFDGSPEFDKAYPVVVQAEGRSAVSIAKIETLHRPVSSQLNSAGVVCSIHCSDDLCPNWSRICASGVPVWKTMMNSLFTI